MKITEQFTQTNRLHNDAPTQLYIGISKCKYTPTPKQVCAHIYIHAYLQTKKKYKITLIYECVQGRVLKSLENDKMS